jgi:antitoxin (DNA-binding transcriptional repressor) of toxin-antitoxin stability system
MRLSASKLRENIYRILDQVLESGLPVEVERKGRVVRIVPADSASKLSRLKRRPRYLRAEPDEIVHLDWSREWRP